MAIDTSWLTTRRGRQGKLSVRLQATTIGRTLSPILTETGHKIERNDRSQKSLHSAKGLERAQSHRYRENSRSTSFVRLLDKTEKPNNRRIKQWCDGLISPVETSCFCFAHQSPRVTLSSVSDMTNIVAFTYADQKHLQISV